MKRTLICAAFTAVFLVGNAARLVAGDVPARAPHVIETTPTLGAINVPVNLDHILVRFDQPMRTGSWSWCGGGYGFPELTDRPRFLDPYTAILPVRLAPQHTYSLGINCPSAGNFISEAGVSAEPLALSFTTGWANGQLPTANIANQSSWLEFRRLFDSVYSYRDRTGTDWNEWFGEKTPWIMEAPSPQEWAIRLALTLGPADDPHLYLRLPNGDRISTHRRRGTVNWNRAAIHREFPDMRGGNTPVEWARRDDIGYLAIHSWSLSEEHIQQVEDALDELTTSTAALILDMRGNGGGNEDQAQRIAGRFIDKTLRYARHRFRDPESDDGFGPMRERWIRPHPEGKYYDGKVYVLQGPVCMSSNEAFLLMMKLGNSVSIGATSAGSSGNPKAYDLPNGVQIILPRWQALTAEGKAIEGIGIAPEIEVIDGDWKHGDPVLERALREANAFIQSNATSSGTGALAR